MTEHEYLLVNKCILFSMYTYICIYVRTNVYIINILINVYIKCVHTCTQFIQISDL